MNSYTLGRYHVEEFGSIAEFLDKIETPHPNACGNVVRGTRERDPDWTFGIDYEAARALASTGWPEGAARVAKLAGELAPTLTPAAETVYDVAGWGLDIGRYLDGEPEHWLATIDAVRPIVRLGLNIFATCGTTADEYAKRGAAVVALADRIEREGARAELWIGVGARAEDSRKLHAWGLIPLKAADQPLDVDRVGFWFAHPAACRMLGFAWFESLDNRRVGIESHYGLLLDTPPPFEGDHAEITWLPNLHVSSDRWREAAEAIIAQASAAAA